MRSLPATAKSTPLRKKQQGFLPARSDRKFMHADEVYNNLCNEMRDQFLGPMPIREFFETYFLCDDDFDFESIDLSLTAVDFLPAFRHLVEQKIVRIQRNS